MYERSAYILGVPYRMPTIVHTTSLRYGISSDQIASTLYPRRIYNRVVIQTSKIASKGDRTCPKYRQYHLSTGYTRVYIEYVRTWCGVYYTTRGTTLTRQYSRVYGVRCKMEKPFEVILILSPRVIASYTDYSFVHNTAVINRCLPFGYFIITQVSIFWFWCGYVRNDISKM